MLDAANKEHLRPIDFAQYNTDVWDILHRAAVGDMPEINQTHDVPQIPDYAIAAGTAEKKKKKKGKGKKGKKGGKKKGKKKKKK